MARAVSESTMTVMASLGDAPMLARHGSISDHIALTLRQAIVNAELPPGTLLAESDLASRFGVSRTPVRQAFHLLTQQGLLLVAPQRGTYVSKLNRAVLRDALFVREALECAAIQLAANAPLSDKQQLQDIIGEQSRAIVRRDVDAILRADEAFHRALMTLSNHGGVWPLVLQARGHLDRLRRMASLAINGSQDALEHHQRIALAVIQGNGDQARDLLRDHIRQVEGFIDRIAEIHPQYIE